jgi:prepilin-type N-terminal cleavage/methylation domain-containing protein
VLKHLKSSDSWDQKTLGAKGFTLIELLVVIVILGILGAVVVFSVRGVSKDSQTNACKTEKRTLETAVESYYAANFGYTSEANLVTAGLIRSQSDNYDVSSANVTATAGGKCVGI